MGANNVAQNAARALLLLALSIFGLSQESVGQASLNFEQTDDTFSLDISTGELRGHKVLFWRHRVLFTCLGGDGSPQGIQFDLVKPIIPEKSSWSTDIDSGLLTIRFQKKEMGQWEAQDVKPFFTNPDNAPDEIPGGGWPVEVKITSPVMDARIPNPSVAITVLASGSVPRDAVLVIAVNRDPNFFERPFFKVEEKMEVIEGSLYKVSRGESGNLLAEGVDGDDGEDGGVPDEPRLDLEALALVDPLASLGGIALERNSHSFSLYHMGNGPNEVAVQLFRDGVPLSKPTTVVFYVEEVERSIEILYPSDGEVIEYTSNVAIEFELRNITVPEDGTLLVFLNSTLINSHKDIPEDKPDQLLIVRDLADGTYNLTMAVADRFGYLMRDVSHSVTFSKYFANDAEIVLLLPDPTDPMNVFTESSCCTFSWGVRNWDPVRNEAQTMIDIDGKWGRFTNRSQWVLPNRLLPLGEHTLHLQILDRHELPIGEMLNYTFYVGTDQASGAARCVDNNGKLRQLGEDGQTRAEKFFGIGEEEVSEEELRRALVIGNQQANLLDMDEKMKELEKETRKGKTIGTEENRDIKVKLLHVESNAKKLVLLKAFATVDDVILTVNIRKLFPKKVASLMDEDGFEVERGVIIEHFEAQYGAAYFTVAFEDDSARKLGRPTTTAVGRKSRKYGVDGVYGVYSGAAKTPQPRNENMEIAQ